MNYYIITQYQQLLIQRNLIEMWDFLKKKYGYPWRIRDYRARTFNFTGVVYPIAFYFHATRNLSNDSLNLEFKVLDYKLCNLTSLSNHTDSYILDIELNKLYCLKWII